MRSGMFPTLVLTPAAETRLRTYSSLSSFEYAWFTDWQLAIGVDTLRAVVKILNGTSTFQAYVVIQTAAVRTDNPGAPTTLGIAITVGETCTHNIAVSSYTGNSVMWFRLGLAFNNSASSMMICQADVSFQASWSCFGSLIDMTEVQLNALNTSTLIEPLTRWFPASFGQSITVAYVCEGLTFSVSPALQFSTAYQIATTSKEEGGAWTLVGSYVTPPTSAPVETNTGTISIANTTDMWMRVGVAYSLTSGTSANSASLSATVAARCT